MRCNLPHVERILFTVNENYSDAFSKIFMLPARAYDHWTPDFARYLGYSLDKIGQRYVIYIGNKFCASPVVGNVFDMLYRFDMVGKQEQDMSSKTQFHVPQCFTGLRVGDDSIIGLRNNPITIGFIRDWWQMLDKYRNDEYWSDPSVSLREMLWQYSLYDDKFRYYPISPLCNATSMEML
jgi:hypothetical protein